MSDEEPSEEESAADDVAAGPGPNADPKTDVDRYISGEVRALYEVHSYRHAAAILANTYPVELKEIENALLEFRLTQRIIGTPGGNESQVPKLISESLRPAGWLESRITGDLLVRMKQYAEEQLPNGKVRKVQLAEEKPRVVPNFIDGHKIDYVKGRVAFDLEWNSKDQTFDRDLYAFRAFHETGVISVGVMLTRSESLNTVFDKVPQFDKSGRPELHKSGKRAGEPKSVKAKYGASTTWMGKLLYRLNAGRHGGCPVLVFGITPKVVSDWP